MLTYNQILAIKCRIATVQSTDLKKLDIKSAQGQICESWMKKANMIGEEVKKDVGMAIMHGEECGKMLWEWKSLGQHFWDQLEIWAREATGSLWWVVSIAEIPTSGGYNFLYSGVTSSGRGGHQLNHNMFNPKFFLSKRCAGIKMEQRLRKWLTDDFS